MVQYWEPGTQYNYGDVVEYQGQKYKIIQPHRSQSDWAPDVTPALWGRLQDGDCGNTARQEYQPQYQAPQGQQSYQQSEPQYGGEKQSEHHGKLDEVKNWAQEHKQGLEVAGGLAAVGGLATAGLAAYKHHQQPQQHEQEQSYEPNYGQPPAHHTKVEEAKSWAQDHKKELAIGGGLLALAGGVAAYKHHQHEKEQDQRDD